MTTKVKYTASRNYRDFIDGEPPVYVTKKNRRNMLIRKKLTIWDRIKDLFKK
jgi:hypothetical protein